MPEGIGYPKGVTAEQHAAKRPRDKDCVQRLIDKGFSKEEAARKCGALKAVEATPRDKEGFVNIDLNSRKHNLPKGG